MSELPRDVLATIRDVALRELDFDGPVELTSTLQGQLRLDSVSMVVVAVALENRFRVCLHEEDAGAIVTVRDLVDLVCQRVAEQRPAELHP